MQKPIFKISAFIAISYLFSWVIELIAILQNQGAITVEKILPYLLVAQFGPSVGAIIVTWLSEGKAGLKSLFKRILVFRFSVWSYLIVLFTIPVILLLVLFIFGITPGPEYNKIMVYITVMISPVNGLIGSVIRGAGPIGEELGWRGFLLPNLLKKYNDVVSSMILGIFWGFWHLPLFFIAEWRDDVPLQFFFVLYPVSTILITYFMTKAWHLTRQSVFMAIWIHGIINACLGYIPNEKVWNLSSVTSLQLMLIEILALFLMGVTIHLLSLKLLKTKVITNSH